MSRKKKKRNFHGIAFAERKRLAPCALHANSSAAERVQKGAELSSERVGGEPCTHRASSVLEVAGPSVTCALVRSQVRLCPNACFCLALISIMRPACWECISRGWCSAGCHSAFALGDKCLRKLTGTRSFWIAEHARLGGGVAQRAILRGSSPEIPSRPEGWP